MPRAKKEKAIETEAAENLKKARVKKPKVEMFIEYNNKQSSTQEIIDNVIATYTAESGKAEIKTLKIYVKPNENAAYYVVNDDETRRMDVFFC